MVYAFASLSLLPLPIPFFSKSNNIFFKKNPWLPLPICALQSFMLCSPTSPGEPWPKGHPTSLNKDFLCPGPHLEEYFPTGDQDPAEPVTVPLVLPGLWLRQQTASPADGASLAANSNIPVLSTLKYHQDIIYRELCFCILCLGDSNMWYICDFKLLGYVIRLFYWCVVICPEPICGNGQHKNPTKLIKIHKKFKEDIFD